jgi:hypothetical protein
MPTRIPAHRAFARRFVGEVSPVIGRVPPRLDVVEGLATAAEVGEGSRRAPGRAGGRIRAELSQSPASGPGQQCEQPSAGEGGNDRPQVALVAVEAAHHDQGRRGTSDPPTRQTHFRKILSNPAPATATTTAVDHLHAMRMSLTGAGPDRIDLHAHAPFTLLRAALENTCTALWIAGAPSRGERILRRLRLHAKSLKHYEQMLKAQGVDCAAEVAGRRDRLQQVADTNGISAATLNTQLQPTEILKTVGRQLCDEPDDQTLVWQLWSLCSAFAHGDWWVMPLLDNEFLGPVSPGVSRVHQTASTQLILDTTREVLHLASESRAYYARLGMRHLGP